MEINNTHSENAEMYLVSMAMLEESGITAPISIPRLAEEMEVQTVSANQMIRKLEEEGLVTYVPYKGVSFTPVGREVVEPILRNRRLWEVFFVRELNFTPTEADALACRMEHITQPEVAARLSERLGDPATSPTGRPIPHPEAGKSLITGTPLNELQPGRQAEVLQINLEPATGEYLRSEGLLPGAIVSVAAVSSNGSVLLDMSDRKLSLSGAISSRIITAPSQETIQNAA